MYRTPCYTGECSAIRNSEGLWAKSRAQRCADNAGKLGELGITEVTEGCIADLDVSKLSIDSVSEGVN